MENKDEIIIRFKNPGLKKILNSKPLLSGNFGLIIICFFFTFFTVKCNGINVVSVTGFDLITGKEIDGSELFNGSAFDSWLDGDTETTAEEENDNVEPNIFAMLALLSALTGMVFYLPRFQKDYLVGIIAGFAGIISLLLLYLSSMSEDVDIDFMKIEVNFAFAYWFALALFFLAIALGFLRKKWNAKVTRNVSAEFKEENIESQQ